MDGITRHHDPRAVNELGAGDHQRHDGRSDHANAVEHSRFLPARLAGLAPVGDHARLRQREAGEHAHRVQRDQRVEVALKDDEQHDRQPGQQHDAGGERQPVAAELEQARQEAVAGEEEAQPAGSRRTRYWRPAPGSVRSHTAARPTSRLRRRSVRPSCDSTVSSVAGRMWIWVARNDMPRNIVPRMTPIASSVLRALSASGGLKASTPSEIASVPVIAVQP